MSAWKHFGHDVQRTSADPDGNITALGEKWVRYGGSDSKNGWAGGAITDDDSIYFFFTSYDPNIGGTGDRFSLAKYDFNGVLKWVNKTLGGHNTRKMWAAKIGSYIQFHDYRYLRVDPLTGLSAGGYVAGDSYGSIVTNPGETKHFSARVSANEGFQGFIWVKGFDTSIFPSALHPEVLWTRNAANSGDIVTDQNKFSIAYDNSKIFYAPNYLVSASSGGWNFPSGVYCWDESGTLQWSVTTTPMQFSAMSVGNNLIYLYEGSSLVARNQSDGSVAWSAALPGTLVYAQPPVLANGMAIIATSAGVHAYNATTGAAVWNNAIADLNVSNSNDTNKYTVLAAALTSDTLIATALGGVYVLNLSDGSQVQLYNPPSVTAAGTGARAVNPIVVGGRVYITVTFHAYSATYPQALICLEDGAVPPPSDTTPPSTPGMATFTNVTHNSMTVLWGPSTDNVGVTSYQLYWGQAGGTKNVVSKTTTSHNLTGLLPNTTYEFYVVAADAAGNLSIASSTSTRTTLQEPVEPPEPPVTVQLSGSVSINAATGQKTVHTLNWNGTSDSVVLQRRTSKTSYATIYSGSAPHSYIQPDMKTTYHYRLVINGTTFSNEISLRSSRK